MRVILDSELAEDATGYVGTLISGVRNSSVYGALYCQGHRSFICAHVEDSIHLRLDAPSPDGTLLPAKITVPIIREPLPHRSSLYVMLLLGEPDSNGYRAVSDDSTEDFGFIGPHDGRRDLRDIVLPYLMTADRPSCERCGDHVDPVAMYKGISRESRLGLAHTAALISTSQCWDCLTSADDADLVPAL